MPWFRSGRLWVVVCALLLPVLAWGEEDGVEDASQLTADERVEFEKHLSEFLEAAKGGNDEQAIVTGRRLLDFLEGTGKQLAETTAVLEALEGHYVALERWDEALEIAQRNARLVAELFGADYWLAANAQWRVRRVEFLKGLSLEDRQEFNRAVKMSQQAAQLVNGSRLAQALALQEQVVAIDERLLPAACPALCLDLLQLGGILRGMGRYAEAQAQLERALEMARQLYPADQYPDGHPHIPQVANHLAMLRADIGNGRLALDEMRDVLAMYERLYPEPFGPRIELATAYNNLAHMEVAAGEFASAAAHARRAIEVFGALFPEAQFPQGHGTIAVALQGLGQALAALGERDQARDAFERSVQIFTAYYSPDKYPRGHQNLATALLRLAMLLAEDRQIDRALPLAARSIAMHETLYPVDEFPDSHDALAAAYNSYSLVLRDAGDAEGERQFVLKAVAASEALYGPERFPAGHPELARALCNASQILVAAGEMAAAEQYLERARIIYEHVYSFESFPRGHRYLAIFRQILGEFRVRQGRYGEALSLLVEAQRMQTVLMEDTLGGIAEPTMRGYLATQRGWDNLLLTVLAAIEAPTPNQIDGVYNVFADRKTAVFDALLRARRAQRDALAEPEVAAQVTALQAARQELANLALRPASPEIEAQRATVARQVVELEGKLNLSLSAPPTVWGPRLAVTAAVVAEFGFDAALVDMLRYQPYDFASRALLPARYGAFVLRGRPGADPQWVDLGPAEPIDQLVPVLRREVEQARGALAVSSEAELEAQFREPAQRLHDLVFTPLRKAMDGATTVFISPDAELNRIPLEALVDEQGHYLVETHGFVYLSGGRDLYVGQPTPAAGTVIFAAPDYKLDGQPAPPSDALAAQLRGADDDAFQGATSIDIRGLNWSPLPATVEESRQIAAILGDRSEYGPVVTLSGADALEDTLKRLRAPRVLHLATHGYYLPNQSAIDTGGSAGDGDNRGGLTAAKALAMLKAQESPLLRAGVVLAGANRKTGSGGEAALAHDDGWVTAEEIGLLDLTGTELVVLSACETGLGDVRTGEGVSGLRRAFLFAGARSLVTSLYKVPDGDTQRLMVEFYRGLAASKPKLTALREAELSAIARRRQEHGAAHPFFWASFILVGDPR